MKGVRYIYTTSLLEFTHVTSYAIHRCVSTSELLQEEVTPESSSIAPPPVFSREPYPPLSSQNNTTVLEELKCVVCANVLSQPLELPCGKLACTSCIVERVTASATVCPCCLLDGGLVSTEIKPASNLIQLLLKDVLVQCVVCHRDVKAGYYEDHECTQSLTPGEEREAAGLLKRAISTSLDRHSTAGYSRDG